MKLGHELILSQTQKLVLTPELRQAIELLQFTNQELKEYIDEELQENPMLEREQEESYESLDDEINWKDYIEKNRDSGYIGEQIDRNQKDYDYTNFVSYNPQLKETLLLQLNVLDITKEELAIGHFLEINGDQGGSVFGQVARLGHDHGNSFAHEGDFVTGQHKGDGVLGQDGKGKA